MAKLMGVWGVAVLTALVLGMVGQATQNETLMLVAFFTCKLMWFVYLALLLEWMARLRTVQGWMRPAAPRHVSRRRRLLPH